MRTFTFITFGGPKKMFEIPVNRICREANKFSIFNKIYGFSDITDDLNILQ